MAITYISYTREQRSNCDVTGYSLYVNECYCCTFDSMQEIKREASRYEHNGDVEIYQVLRRRH